MTTPTQLRDRILARADKGQDVATIAAALNVSPGHVYAILREHRPNRARKPRRATSDLPRMIGGLKRAGLKPARIGVVLGVSRAYVYRHIGMVK